MCECAACIAAKRTGPGCSVWTGRPTRERIRRISMLTMKLNDRMYWRNDTFGPWRKLDRPTRQAEYDALNRVLGRF